MYIEYQTDSFRCILPEGFKINSKFPRFLASTPRKVKNRKSISISKIGCYETEAKKRMYATQFSQEVEFGYAQMKRKGGYANSNLTGFEFVYDFLETATMKGRYVWAIFVDLQDDIKLVIEVSGLGKFEDDEAYWTPVVDSICCDR